MTPAASGQDGFAYDSNDLLALEKYISAERLAPYVIQARGDKWLAIRLYERNTELSEALYGVIQSLEITLRNAIHEKLSKELATNEWYDSIHFEETERVQIDQAKEKILSCGTTLSPGKVISELNFGFWVRLFSHTYDKSLWVAHLRKIFPMKLDGRRSFVNGRLVELKTLRNRIAHHERITCGKRNVEKDYEQILETLGWISPRIKTWTESTNCFQERFTKQMPSRPVPEAGTEAPVQ